MFKLTEYVARFAPPVPLPLVFLGLRMPDGRLYLAPYGTPTPVPGEPLSPAWLEVEEA